MQQECYACALGGISWACGPGLVDQGWYSTLWRGLFSAFQALSVLDLGVGCSIIYNMFIMPICQSTIILCWFVLSTAPYIILSFHELHVSPNLFSMQFLQISRLGSSLGVRHCHREERANQLSVFVDSGVWVCACVCVWTRRKGRDWAKSWMNRIFYLKITLGKKKNAESIFGSPSWICLCMENSVVMELFIQFKYDRFRLITWSWNGGASYIQDRLLFGPIRTTILAMQKHTDTFRTKHFLILPLQVLPSNVQYIFITIYSSFFKVFVLQLINRKTPFTGPFAWSRWYRQRQKRS